MAATPGAPKIEGYRFADDGRVPNNPRLPLIVYRGALKTGGDAAASCVALFHRNGWTGAWQNGVYSHHHYHSSAHEVLGIAADWVRVRLGGESGQTVETARRRCRGDPSRRCPQERGAKPGPSRGRRLSARAEPRYVPPGCCGSRMGGAANRRGAAARRRPGPWAFRAAARALARHRTRLIRSLWVSLRGAL